MNIQAVIDAVKSTVNSWLFPERVDFPVHTPERLLIGCIDARMPIAALGYAPGTTLIKRNIAALVPNVHDDRGADIAATLEFAIKTKRIKEIVVMGHTDCGGIDACLGDATDLHFVKEYLSPLNHVRDKVKKNGGDKQVQARTMEIAAVCMSLENLKSYTSVQQAMKNGLQLRGRLLDVRTNEVYSIDETEQGVFLKPYLHAELPQPQTRLGGNLGR